MNTIVKENKKFGYVITGALLAILIFRFVKTAHLSWGYSLPALVLLCLTVFAPRYLTRVRLMWEQLGEWLGYINSILILSLIYFIIITPIALVARILKKDPLKIRLNTAGETYWEPVDNKIKGNLHQQF